MAVIINLIIIFIVLYTVLKRVNEISKKSGEIKVPPAVPRVPLPELMEGYPPLMETSRPLRREVEEEEETFETVLKESAPWEETLETVREEIHEPVVSEAPELYRMPFPQPVFEKAAPIEIKPHLTEHLRLRAERKPPAVPALRFSRNDVVRGFVMGEILGRPLSLREKAWI